MWWLYIPLLIIGVVLVVFLLLVLLGRYRNGALLRPVIAKLSRIGFMRRFFTQASAPRRSSARTPSSRAR